MEYMYHYGSMKSLAELAMIRSIDYETRQLLAQCLFVGDKNEEKKFPSLSNIAKYGKHQIIATGHIPCYDHKGDKWGYLGYNYKHWIKYEFKYGKWIKAGEFELDKSLSPVLYTIYFNSPVILDAFLIVPKDLNKEGIDVRQSVVEMRCVAS